MAKKERKKTIWPAGKRARRLDAGLHADKDRHRHDLERDPGQDTTRVIGQFAAASSLGTEVTLPPLPGSLPRCPTHAAEAPMPNFRCDDGHQASR